ncbi:unnamed protein product, partial [Closterium sp. NIES-53]
RNRFCSDLIRTSIVKVGDTKVIQLVMDNASNNKSATAILGEGYPSVFFTNCAADCLDLMLHDMGKICIVKKVLTQVHRIVMMVKGSASAVALFRTIFSKQELVRPGTTRFGTHVIMVTRFLEVTEKLRQLVISDQWKEVAMSKTEDAKKIRKLLLDDIFWESVKLVQQLMMPIYNLLRAVDTRALVMGSIYGMMLEATVAVNEAAEGAGKQCCTPITSAP